MTEETMTHAEKERLRALRRRAVAKLEDALRALEHKKMNRDQFQSVMLGISVEALDLIVEYAKTHPKLADIAETVVEWSTCRDCNKVFLPSEVIFIVWSNGYIDVYCLPCYADKRHKLYG